MSDIACIVPIFNYAGDPVVEANHLRGVGALSREPGVRVCTARAEGGDALWQKEALINREVQRLAGACPIVAWVDSGILLTPGWAARLRLEMKLGADAVQLFHRGIWWDQDDQPASSRWGFVWWHQSGRPGLYPGPKASVGGAWAARAELLDRLPLYDRQVVGGGDTWVLNGYLGVNTPEALVTRNLTAEHRHDVQQWIIAARRLSPRTTWVPGEYRHMWHTPQSRRYHAMRHDMLVEEGYNPRRHVELREDGLLYWTSTTPEMLRARVQNFLLSRSSQAPLRDAL